ncbi:SET domain-containing protein [Gloeophyllum trabeum ATCC 11539]|uniref:SET domain-containing protein n=1 Tax=Gloeophyllum trabeum (strain ATCC 11539 / FP-39264 / Madison 617) TaxID=670483 RepID=S7S5N8_GLOTA|nr:SET domain-containing protein [Gloeophyllum trabeum ATCC 11539]EPQ61319.1 SET domain-containing protein [Gloeophyllum trabeum ATCC 11539]
MPKQTSSRSVPDLWKVSESEEEDFGDDTGEWPVDGVVGEEIDMLGVSRYEIRWRNWRRKDGTNTTWAKQMPDRPDLIEDWNTTQAKKRQKQADESLDVALEPLNILDIHNIKTAKRSQAVEEKVENSYSRGIARYDNWDAVESVPSCPGPSSSRRSSTMKSEDIYKNPSRASTAHSNTHSSTSAKDAQPIYSLKEKWNNSARKIGAARITITNEIDEEAEPQLVEGFKYLENRYSYPKDIRALMEESEPYFVFCQCKACADASVCACQGPSELVDADGDKTWAYTSEGLFAFNVPPGVEVIECNKFCACGKRQRCPNRVAQKPRDTPIDVFKTEDRGWGARATVDVPRGKVLGIYTGRVIPREDLEHLSHEHRGYTFNLDARENRGDDDSAEKYTVDAYSYGNWTRFIK